LLTLGPVGASWSDIQVNKKKMERFIRDATDYMWASKLDLNLVCGLNFLCVAGGFMTPLASTAWISPFVGGSGCLFIGL
jgi:hypothetical protein